MCISYFAPYNKEIKVQREREEIVKIKAHTSHVTKARKITRLLQYTGKPDRETNTLHDFSC